MGLLSRHASNWRTSCARLTGRSSKPAPIPPDVLAALLTGSQPVLVATGSGDDVLAVYAPHDINWELAWIAELLTGR